MGINVYTNGEMLPAHAYPELKKYPHLVGNYGSAWQNQQKEFANFPGAIVMTSNCLLNPNVGNMQIACLLVALLAGRVWRISKGTISQP